MLLVKVTAALHEVSVVLLSELAGEEYLVALYIVVLLHDGALIKSSSAQLARLFLV